MNEKQRDRFAAHIQSINAWKDGVIDRHGSIIGFRILHSLAHVGPILGEVVYETSGKISPAQAIEELQYYVDFVREDLEKHGDLSEE